jgi:hypothetical protein
MIPQTVPDYRILDKLRLGSTGEACCPRYTKARRDKRNKGIATVT